MTTPSNRGAETGLPFQEWRPVPGYPGIEAHYFGHVVAGERVLRQHQSTKGYLRVSVRGKEVGVHRLVALAHIPNPHGYPEVNHLDGNKGNNLASNLEWCTRSQNMKHAYATGLHPGVRLSGVDSPSFGRKGKLHHQSMAIRATFPDGRTLDFESQGMAGEQGFKAHKISQCINGRRRSHAGATWRPLPDPPTGTPKVEEREGTSCTDQGSEGPDGPFASDRSRKSEGGARG